MVLSTNNCSFPSNSHVSATFSILLRFGNPGVRQIVRNSTYPSVDPPSIAMGSPLPYSRMVSEATCGTISGLGSIKLSSEFSTLAFPYTIQSTSSEVSPKGVVSAQPSLEYLSLILFTNSESNSPCGYSPWTLTAKPTHPSTQIYNAHLDRRSTLR